MAANSPTLPLSLAQQGLLSPKANANASIRFKGELSIPALCRALAFIMRRHEALRIRVVDLNEQAQQYFVDPIDSLDIPVISVDNVAAAGDRIMVRLLSSTDLEKNGPLHAELLRIREDDHVLLLTLHLIASDAYSEALFIKELLNSYGFYVRDQEPCLPLAMRFSDYVLNEAQCGERLSDTQLQYWRSALSGSRDPIYGREGHSAFPRAKVRVVASSLSSVETQRLLEFASEANVSMAAAIYASILLAVSKQYLADDITATVVYSGRDSRLLATLGARTARTFRLRMLVDSKVSLAEFTRRVHGAFLCGAMASRAPFTLSRAMTQVAVGPPAEPNGSAGLQTAGQRVQLIIDDVMVVQRELEPPAIRLSAERFVLGPLVHDGRELDEASRSLAAPLLLMLRRDLVIETGRPLTIVGIFQSHTLDETEVGHLLGKISDTARLMRPNCKL